LYSKILVLHFPSWEVEKPVVCHLTKYYDLIFTILKATILPRKEGIMVLELSGSKKNFKTAIQYLKDQGVIVKNASQEITRDETKCIHCGACTAVCPTAALAVSRPDMYIRFDKKKCSVCELCIPTCLTRAMKIQPTSESLFE
jgi:ferredoxin